VSELERASAVIESVTSIRPVLMRPPFGDDPLRASELARPLGLTAALWSVPTFDWRGDPATEVADRIVTGARPGAVVVLHDASHLGERRPNTVEALRQAVPVLTGQGYELVTLSELLRSARYARRWVIPRRRTGLRRVVDVVRGLKGGDSAAQSA
jgi:peptidoglycan/xylan/chitin deacetylase (PgdA/CDA1 family)